MPRPLPCTRSLSRCSWRSTRTGRRCASPPLTPRWPSSLARQAAVPPRLARPMCRGRQAWPATAEQLACLFGFKVCLARCCASAVSAPHCDVLCSCPLLMLRRSRASARRSSRRPRRRRLWASWRRSGGTTRSGWAPSAGRRSRRSSRCTGTPPQRSGRSPTHQPAGRVQRRTAAWPRPSAGVPISHRLRL